MKWSILGYILLTAILTIAIFTPYSLHPFDRLPNSIDPVFYAWNLQHNFDSMTHGLKNLLDTNIFYPEGNTLALSDTLFAQTFLTAPIIALTQNPVLAQNIYIFATFPLAALSMYFLTYYLTGANAASMLAGIFYAFSYPRLSQIGHMPALSSQWLPLVFLFIIRWVRTHTFSDLLWLFIWFLASITSTLYFGIFLIPLSLLLFLSQLKNSIPILTRQFLILFIPAAIILFLVLFPYVRLRAEYPGIRRSLEDAARLSAEPKDYLAVLPTSWLGDVGLPVSTNERVLYPTLTLLILALFSLFSRFRKPAFIFLAIALVAFVLSLGPDAVAYRYLYKIFPLLESIRVPARFSIFVILGLCVGASFTLRSFSSKTMYLVIFLLFLTEVWQVQTPSVPVPQWKDAPAVYHFLEKQPDSDIIIELPLIPEWDASRMEEQIEKPHYQATEKDVYVLEAFRTYFSGFHRKRMLNGYSGYFPNVYHDNTILLSDFPSKDSIEMLLKRKVLYIIVHGSEYADKPFLGIQRRIRDYPELKLVTNFGEDYVYEIH